MKKILVINTKLRYYLKVICPKAAAECLGLTEKIMMEELEIAERKVLRKKLGPFKGEKQYGIRHNCELYSHIEKITD